MKKFIVKSKQSPALKVDKLLNTRSLDNGWWRCDCNDEDAVFVREAMKKHNIEILASR